MTTCLRAVSLGAALFLLAACGTNTPDTPVDKQAAAIAKAAEAGGTGIKLRPGRWQMQTQMMEFDMPGIPAGMQKSIRKQMSTAANLTTCLTQDEADRGDGKFFEPRDRDCKYRTFSMANGQIAAQMTCSDNGGTQSVDVSGSYTPESYDLRFATSGDVSGASMNMSMHTSGIRVGECTGGEQ